MKLSVIFQRLEAVFVFWGAIFLYQLFEFSFLWFIVLLFAVDIFMVGYVVNKHVGAYVYNIGHSFVIPVVLLCVGAATDTSYVLGLGLIWLAHIGLDRSLGYGLKEESDFKHTHLGIIGKHKG